MKLCVKYIYIFIYVTKPKVLQATGLHSHRSQMALRSATEADPLTTCYKMRPKDLESCTEL